MRYVAVLASGLALLAVFPPPAGAAHPHYERLLREGTFALERGEAAEAAEVLRLACFGFLEEPETLALCLTRLALAQAAAGDGEGFRNTFRRVAEVEGRFDGYSRADMPPATRTAFETEIAARIPPQILADTPVFRHLVPTPEAGAEPSAGEAATVDAPLETPPEPADPPAPAPLTADQVAKLDRARELLSEAQDRGELEEPWRLAREVADTRPERRDAQHLAAVIAYRAGRWADAVAYFQRGGEPDEGSPEVLFYLAVSLYEVGEREAAADVLRRSLPRIEHTPFVLAYRDKILGPSGTGSGDG